jgi:hypothetical protein
LIVAVIGFIAALRDAPQPLPSPVAADAAPVPTEIDFPRLALKPRAYVEGIIGKPTSYQPKGQGELGDAATYAWGLMLYNRGRAIAIFYTFPHRPLDYHQAFAMLGLPSPHAPYIREADQTMIWHAPIAQAYPNTFKGAYYCCGGATFEDIFITGDLSAMHVYVLDLDNKALWGPAEWSTWKAFTTATAASH